MPPWSHRPGLTGDYIRAKHAAGWSDEQIAAATGRKPGTIAQWRGHLGLPANYRPLDGRRKATDAEIIKAADAAATMAEAARSLGITRESFRRRLDSLPGRLGDQFVRRPGRGGAKPGGGVPDSAILDTADLPPKEAADAVGLSYTQLMYRRRRLAREVEFRHRGHCCGQARVRAGAAPVESR